MVGEADTVLLFPRAILDVEDADEVGSPASHEAVEELQDHAGDHPQLRERVGQRQQHLSHLQSTTKMIFFLIYLRLSS